MLIALDDMCVLVSATTPNSCKLAVYEGEVLRKNSTFLSFTPSGKEKTRERRSTAATDRRDSGQARSKFRLEITLGNLIKNVYLLNNDCLAYNEDRS